jgi:hypothetical protein
LAGENFQPIPRSEQNYPMPIAYRCGQCGAEFPTYALGDRDATAAAEKAAHAHRAQHRKQP